MSWQKQGGHGISGANRSGGLCAFALFVLVFLTPLAAGARDAAFLDPGGGSAGTSDEAVRVEPKGDIDIGESIIGVARRVDLFFVNQSGVAVKIQKMAINGDGNVAAEIATDDCSKQGTIAPGSRCNVEASVTPTSPGPWSAEVLLTHDGAGRIARAKLSGKTGGAASSDKKDTGLSLSTKEINPVNFGDVEVGNGKVVRSALMVNDSAEPITLYSIDVIEASNGLQRLEQGCAVDMELKPGESCPVTLVWTPMENGQVSTDLIIRHSGRLGFAVVPIRGAAKGGVASSETREKTGSQTTTPVSTSSGGKSSLPPPPSATDLEKAAAGKIMPVLAAALGGGTKAPEGHLALIGTVGDRGVFVKPDGQTTVVNAGDEIDLGDKNVKVTKIDARSADVVIDGKKKTLFLEASAELIAKAAALATKSKDANKDAKESTTEILGSAPNNAPPAPPLGASSAPSGGLSMPSGSVYGSATSTPSGAAR